MDWRTSDDPIRSKTRIHEMPLAGTAVAVVAVDARHGLGRCRLDAAFAARLQMARVTRRRFGSDGVNE